MPEYNPNTPWVVFALDNEEYCVNSMFVDSITLPAEMTRMPNNPIHLVGVMPYSDLHIPVIDARTLLGMETLAEAINDFGVMRQMHVDWVDALKDSVTNHVPFTKAVNPHKCKFGMWFDNYHTDNVSLNFILGKIEEPHAAIHRLGADAQKLMAHGDWDGARECYRKAEDICKNTVLPLLDSLIETYRDSNRGMVIVLRGEDGSQLGLMVDQIARLTPGNKISHAPVPAGVSVRDGFIADMVLDGKHTLANLDIPRLFEYMGTHAAEVETALALAGGSN
ncbi:MAG: hypothetical protein HDQ87_04155 [Clostridia bacterium]|nr:hypothetical protein [Clostridia bacterium]